MREILYMYLPGCPYCAQADAMIAKLVSEEERFKAVSVRKADETIETKLSKSLDYWYVPCMFVDGKKILEGVPTIEKIREVFEEALK